MGNQSDSARASSDGNGGVVVEITSPFYGCSGVLTLQTARVFLKELRTAIQSAELQLGGTADVEGTN